MQEYATKVVQVTRDIRPATGGRGGRSLSSCRSGGNRRRGSMATPSTRCLRRQRSTRMGRRSFPVSL